MKKKTVKKTTKNAWRGTTRLTRYPQTQKIFFDTGERREIHNIVDIKSGRTTHLYISDGSEVIIQDRRVLFTVVLADTEA